MSTQPNILLITTDEMRFDHLGLMGLKGIDTPNLDRLGREGIHFNRGYTSSPICTPARLTLLTGQYPSIHGGYSIGVTPDPFPKQTLPGILGESGYATALIGKSHFVCREDENRHLTGQDNPPVEFFANNTGPSDGFDYVQIATHHTTNGKPECHYQAWLEEKGVDYSQWFPDVHGKHDHQQTGVWNIPVEYHDSTWITTKTLERIDDCEDSPWFIWASYNDPHEPFLCPEPWFSSVRADEIELYEGYREGEFDDKPPFYNKVFQTGVWGEAYENEPGNGVPCAFRRKNFETDEKQMEAMQATLGMIAMIDHEVGQLISALEKKGMADNTIVVFTTDHGDIHGNHSLWHKGLFAYEDCQRIPFLAWGPGLVKAQGTSEALVNLVDLPRTFMSMAGISTPQGVQGEDLTPIFSGEKESVQDETLVELQATKKIYQQSFITDCYKLIVYRDESYGELYDLQLDPDQYTNLWDKPECAGIKAELMHRFVQFNMKKEGYAHDRKAFA